MSFKNGVTGIAGCGREPLSVVQGVLEATCTTSALTAGNHPITATYSGDANFATFTSFSLTQVVNAH